MRIVITGGSRGIGAATARELAKDHEVIITYATGKEEAMKLAKEIICRAIELNLLDNHSIMRFSDNIIREFKEIDVLINNAGVIAWKKLEDQSFEEIESQVRVNFEGLVKLTKMLLPYIRSMVINIASGAGKEAFPGLSTYCGTKFAVRGFTKSMALENKKIKFISINPGMTATRMTNFRGVKPEAVARIISDVVNGKIKKASGSDVDVWDYVF